MAGKIPAAVLAVTLLMPVVLASGCAQQGNANDSGSPDNSSNPNNNSVNGTQLKPCDAYMGSQVCTMVYQPVCARVEIGTNAPYTVEWRTFGNACMACISSTRTSVVAGYAEGECQAGANQSGGGAAGGTGVLSPSVQDCSRHEGEYVITNSPDGSQSGYCSLPDGSTCTDDQYFNGQPCYSDQFNIR